ncbi:tyrosine-type recombinase/integrase [Flavobacterium sp. HNIBRBA15423]|uniref:tyrosine-type recombinase/integrase n=1 Tax=Flavobacterium sp. HNIBRBA15423 TaxID=3458683 RepID=UPI004044C3DE
MNDQKQISEVIDLWKTNKKQYVKKSSFSAYTLLIENHLLPIFGNKYSIEEREVQAFVFQKLESGLSQKTIKDILIVLKMILKYGAKHKWLNYNPFDIQFPTEREKYYKNLMKELKMPDLKFHGLRHSFATRCIESNCDYKTVSVLLGHSNISTTLNLYVHPNMEQKKKAIEQMFKALR